MLLAGLEDAGWIGRPKADLILDDAERRQLQQWARQARTVVHVHFTPTGNSLADYLTKVGTTGQQTEQN